jgi:hypothetical protein
MPLVCRAAYSRPHSFALAGVLLAVLLAPSSARASSPPWIDPSPAELQMTSEPKAPGAPAILLSWEEHDDANSAEVVVHVRLKVLTEGGLSAGTLDLPDGVVSNDTLRQIFFARTIHPTAPSSYSPEPHRTQQSLMLTMEHARSSPCPPSP